MASFLTSQSVMMCPHGGSVQATATASNLTAGGAPVLTTSDVFVIAGCAFVVGVVPHPCTTIQWVQPTLKSTRSSVATLTESSLGFCVAADQAPQGPVQVVTTQTSAGGL
jgi:hypothetical protein